MRRTLIPIAVGIGLGVFVAAFLGYFVVSKESAYWVDGLARPLGTAPWVARFVFGSDKEWAGWSWFFLDLLWFWAGIGLAIFLGSLAGERPAASSFPKPVVTVVGIALVLGAAYVTQHAIKVGVAFGLEAGMGFKPSAVLETPAREYVDHQYQFAFQFPADWKIEKNPAPGEAGEVRAIVRHPTKPMRVMATVGHIGKTIMKRHFESIPTPSREAVVEAFVGLTVEQVYKKASRDMGAESMLVSEKRMVPSEAGVGFYISTLHHKGKVPILVAGIHIVPFEKPYIVTFVMIAPVDSTATKNNETITRVFNSFHLLDERPVK